jgi:hypothetical protein
MEEGPTGKFGIFESDGITQIMDNANLVDGDVFYSRFDSLNGRFKKFAYKKLNEDEIAELTKEIDDFPG